jgi:hypothetical protein
MVGATEDGTNLARTLRRVFLAASIGLLYDLVDFSFKTGKFGCVVRHT